MKTAPLKDLAPGQQKRVWDFLKENGGRKTVIFVRNQFGKTVHESSVSEWKSWYQLQLQFHSLDSMRQHFEELLLKKFPQTDPKAVQEFGQAYFTMQAASAGDSETFCNMEKLRILKEKEVRESSRLALDRERFEIEAAEKMLKAINDNRLKQIADSQMSNAEKIRAVRKIAFSDVDAAAKTIAERLPKK